MRRNKKNCSGQNRSNDLPNSSQSPFHVPWQLSQTYQKQHQMISSNALVKQKALSSGDVQTLSPLQFSIFTYYNWPEINPECKTLHMPKKQWNERNLQHGSCTGPRDWILLKLQGVQNYKPLVTALVKGSQGCSTRVILCSMYNHDLSPERTVLRGKQKIWLLCEII